MKKVFTLLVMGIFLLSFMSMAVLAEENGEIDLTGSDDLDVDPGITPDSPFYGLDRALERISLALTFNKAKRSEKSLRHALERLAEVKAMVEENKLKEADEAGDNFGDDLEDIEDDIDEDENAEGVLEALCNTVMQHDKIESHKEKAIQVKNGILVRHANRMSEERLDHLGDVFSKIDGRAESAQNRVAQRQENLKIRYKLLTELSDEEIDEAITQCGEESEDDSDEED